MKLAAQILAVILAAIQAFQKWQRNGEQVKHDEKIAAVKANPAGWLDQHFNGLPDDLPNDAADARQTGDAESNTDT